MASFIFKMILLGGIGWVIFMIATGNMGGAKQATQNYNDVMLKGSPAAQEQRK